jgi:aryl-alcohol dehydrogenase-like predicted oxidoreductase
MAKLSMKEIQAHALALLEEKPGGLRWGDFIKLIHASSPETPTNSIHGAIQKLFASSDDVVKVAVGSYQLKKFHDQQSEAVEPTAPMPAVIAATKPDGLLEGDFYASFAEWLTDVEEAVNVAVPLGGNVLKGKWGTPDVIGVRKPRADEMLKFETQVVSAEIKIDPSQPVVAFGQAVAYRLFSHKSYIVVPRTTSEEDLARLKSLCSIHGVGLVTFTLNKAEPDYAVLVLPAQATPDMFYANQMLKRLLEAAPKIFHKLF